MARARFGTKRLLALLVPITLITACHSWRATNTAPAGGEVRISFPMPQAVHGTLAGGGEMTLDQVAAVRGRVVRASGDTVELQLTDARRMLGQEFPPELYKGGTATIVLGPRTMLESREFSGSKTAMLAGGTGAVLLALLAVAVVVSVVGLLAYQ